MELDPNFKTDWPIRQGDVLGFRNWESQPSLSRFGVIITADCDIANGRPDQELVYLRIVSQADYIDIFWSRRRLERARDKVFQDLVPLINRLRRILSPEVIDLGRQDVEQWIGSTKARDIADEIGVQEPKDKEKLINNLERTRTVVGLTDVAPGSPCLDRLIECTGKARCEIVRQATRDLENLRDEIFFLTGITEPTDQFGYYVLLDQIGAVHRDQISDSLGDVRRGSKQAYRFGRLAPTYKYALAQRFAFLFQRIGLPDDHIERHSKALNRMHSHGTGTREA